MQTKNDSRPKRYFWAPGNYLCMCCLCDDKFIGDKRASTCADCAYDDWVPTHRHVKTGGLYMVTYPTAVLEKDLSSVTVYQGQDGTVWVRPTVEFYDGRFIELREEEDDD